MHDQVARAAAVLALLAVGGCSSTATEEPATFTAIYATLYPTTTNARCNFCHGLQPTDTSNGRLHMGTDQATAYAALVGKTSTSTNCGGRDLVVPGDPEHSLFFLKLSAPPCGNRMPLGGTALNDTQLGMIRSWIAAGAKND